MSIKDFLQSHETIDSYFELGDTFWYCTTDRLIAYTQNTGNTAEQITATPLQNISTIKYSEYTRNSRFLLSSAVYFVLALLSYLTGIHLQLITKQSLPVSIPLSIESLTLITASVLLLPAIIYSIEWIRSSSTTLDIYCDTTNPKLAHIKLTDSTTYPTDERSPMYDFMLVLQRNSTATQKD